MTKLYNIQSQKETRRILRKQPIKSERLLWQKLKNKQLGYKFRRQFGIGKYIVDFYCPKLKFIVEVDGATHCTDGEVAYDKIRQKYLESLEMTIKRYLNSDIYNNLDSVVGDIIETCQNLDRKRPHPNPPLAKGRE